MRAQPYGQGQICGVPLANGERCQKRLGWGSVVCHVHRNTPEGATLARERREAAARAEDERLAARDARQRREQALIAAVRGWRAARATISAPDFKGSAIDVMQFAEWELLKASEDL